MPSSYCCVAGCSSQSTRDRVKLFEFPASMRTHQIWTKFCNRPDDWQPPNRASICSRHFVDGKPTAENPHPTVTYQKPKPKRGLYLPIPIPPEAVGKEGRRFVFCAGPKRSDGNKESVKETPENPQVHPRGSEEDDQEEPELLFWSHTGVRPKRTKQVKGGDQKKQEPKKKRSNGQYIRLTSWYKKAVKNSSSSVDFAILKEAADSIAKKRGIRFNEKYDTWLKQWAKARKIKIDGEEPESDEESHETSDAVGAIEVTSDGEFEEEVPCQQDGIQIPDQLGMSEENHSGTILPTGEQALEALDVLRRYLGILKGTNLAAFKEMEKQVHSKIVFSAFVASIQK